MTVSDAPAKPAKAKAGGLRDQAESRGELLHIDPRKIKPQDGFNIRNFDNKENKLHVRSLADSIKEEGVLNPITVRYDTKTGDILLVDGESRWRATMLAIEEGAEIKTIPAIAESKNTSEADRTLTLLSRNSGKRPEPLEMAKAFKRLSDYGWNDAEIARRAGVTGPYVAGLLKLQAAPASITKMVDSGKISAALAVEAIREADTPEQAIQLLSDAAAEAALQGKDRVTPKHTKAVKDKKKEEAPFYYKKSSINGLLYFLVGDDFWGHADMTRGMKGRLKNFLESIDVDVVEWQKELKESEAEKTK